MFKLLLCLLCLLIFGTSNFKTDNAEIIKSDTQNQASALVEDIVPINKRMALSENSLFIDDYFSNYYFINSVENYGRNEKGSCTQLALAQLLSFLDTYWDDSFVPDQYEKKSLLNSDEFDYGTNAPGIYRESKELVGNLSTYDYYWNVVDKYSDSYFHLLLIKIGYGQFGYYDFDDFSNACALSDGEINNIADYYLYTYLGKAKTDVSISYSNKSSIGNRNYIIENVKNGIPVLARAKISIGGHAMVAYDYDENNDEIYFHAGWESDSRHYSEEQLGLIEYFDALSIIPNTPHVHTNNYFSQDSAITYCPCNSVIPTQITITNNFLDTLPTFEWNSLIKDKWFSDIELHHQIYILRSNHYEVFQIEDRIFDNQYTINLNDWKRIINEVADPDYYVYIAMVSDIAPYWDDFYCIQLFHEPNRYISKSSFLPEDWGIEGRYYFPNELDSSKVSADPDRMYATATQNGLTINTERLRCGYIENKYIVLSPRREDAGRAYFEMNFDKPVYSFMYRACMWSANENLDGLAVIQVKNAQGVWSTFKDIPISSLRTKEDGLTQFTEFTLNGIYGLRFETTSTATGDRNKGRFCLGDIVFSTSLVQGLIPFVDYDYSI